MDRVKSVATTVHQEATIGGIQSIQVMLARTEDLEQQRRRHWEDEMARWRMERQQMMQGSLLLCTLQTLVTNFKKELFSSKY
jgi:hypothetical protein